MENIKKIIMENRTYTRVIFDKLLRDNIVFNLLDKFVKFYCAIFSHPVNSLKFQENFPLKNNMSETSVSTKETEKTKNILG